MAERGVVGGDGDVTQQLKVTAGRDGVSVHLGDRRLWEIPDAQIPLFDRIETLDSHAGGPAAIGRREVWAIAPVPPRAERTPGT